MRRGIIFDMDGTLWDASDVVVASWNIVLEQAPEETRLCTTEWMQQLMGKTVPDLEDSFLGYLPKERRHELMMECMMFENEYIAEHGGAIYPGFEETMALLQKDYSLSIVSNCQKGYIPAFFTAHDMQKYFDDYEENGRTGLVKADNIRLVMERNHLDEAVYVGDTMGDYNAAKDAGIPFIHSAYGYGEVPEGTPEIHSLSELPEAVAAVFKD